MSDAIKTRWEYRMVVVDRHEDPTTDGNVLHLLDMGFEPFAVQGFEYQGVEVHLKRPYIEADAEVNDG